MSLTDVASCCRGSMLDMFGSPVYSKYSLLERSSTGPLYSTLTSSRFPSYELFARGDFTTMDVGVLCATQRVYNNVNTCSMEPCIIAK